MDSTGTFEIYDVLSKYNIITAMNKFYNIDDYKAANNRKIYTDDGETVFATYAVEVTNIAPYNGQIEVYLSLIHI